MAVEYVRVKDKETGHHVSITRERYDRDPDLWQKLQQDAADAGGVPLPPKYKTTVSTEAAKKAGSSANTEKENS